MPKLEYNDSESVRADDWERRVTLNVNKELVQNLSVGDEVEVTMKATVKEVSEEELPRFGEGEEEGTKTVRRLGIQMSAVEVYKRGDNEFEDMARDEGEY